MLEWRMRIAAMVALLPIAACAPTRVIVVQPIPPPPRVEYRCDPWPLPPGAKLDPSLATRYLNEVGAQGWESYIGNEQFVCFKRYAISKPK